nr:YIP1 family protein [Shimazuella soli]
MIWRPHVELERVRLHPAVWLPLAIISIVHVLGMLGITRVKTEEWPLNSVQTPPTITYSYMSMDLLISDLITFLLSVCIVSLLIFAIAKSFRKSVTLKQVLSLSVFLQVIPTLGLLLQAAAHLLEWGENIFSYSLQDLFHLTSSHFSFVFGFVTIFIIWNWVITVVGLHKVIGFPSIIAIVLTIIMWYLPVWISSFFVIPQG